MITNPGRGKNILEQQTFAALKFTSLKSISRSLHISRPKTVIERLSKYLSYF